MSGSKPPNPGGFDNAETLKVFLRRVSHQLLDTFLLVLRPKCLSANQLEGCASAWQNARHHAHSIHLFSAAQEVHQTTEFISSAARFQSAPSLNPCAMLKANAPTPVAIESAPKRPFVSNPLGTSRASPARRVGPHEPLLIFTGFINGLNVFHDSIG